MVKIPTKLEDLLPSAALGRILDVLNQPALSGAVRDALQRVGIKDASPVEQVQEAWQQARDWVGQLANRMVNPVHANPQLINATGELARAEWQGFPMAPTVAEAYGVQGINFHHAARLEEAARQAATKLLQADDAMLTSTLAGSIQLIKSTFAGCAVSRADTVRIPGFGDIGAMLHAGGSDSVHEVGATNGATESDWASVITCPEQIIVLVSPNSLSTSDADLQRAAAMRVSKATGAGVIEIMVDGVCKPLNSESGFHFPLVQQQLQTGAAAVVLPLDGLLGGPAGACVAGNGKLIKALRGSSLAQFFNLRGAALAAAAAALERAALVTPLDTGVLDLLSANLANLKDRAKRMVVQLANTEHVLAAEIVERTISLGGSPWDRYRGHSVAVALTPRKDIANLAGILLSGERGPSILTSTVGDQVLIDLKFVLPRDDHQVVKALYATPPNLIAVAPE